eukprot:TRINITY_DN28789_c0_g1_i2.p1 TRINITY_DN28789_c0_g1~~TRINITY_DN28789_c0_g1_i2.p1  ORF type:complete len:380 (+),score=99.31 TRINITY_DN28789_c0_g1_i2:50-1189(+)
MRSVAAPAPIAAFTARQGDGAVSLCEEAADLRGGRRRLVVATDRALYSLPPAPGEGGSAARFHMGNVTRLVIGRVDRGSVRVRVKGRLRAAEEDVFDFLLPSGAADRLRSAVTAAAPQVVVSAADGRLSPAPPSTSIGRALRADDPLARVPLASLQGTAVPATPVKRQRSKDEAVRVPMAALLSSRAKSPANGGPSLASRRPSPVSSQPLPASGRPSPVGSQPRRPSPSSQPLLTGSRRPSPSSQPLPASRRPSPCTRVSSRSPDVRPPAARSDCGLRSPTGSTSSVAEFRMTATPPPCHVDPAYVLPEPDTDSFLAAEIMAAEEPRRSPPLLVSSRYPLIADVLRSPRAALSRPRTDASRCGGPPAAAHASPRLLNQL